ncbi:hypothetical protein SAMN04488118_10411 [Epibacterium ulvae]|uniref:Uncharacterized protein n=4 Tax=Epibacterium ulvae TaxID=1156985 RepID=A0A1G5QDJ1_9RHOB|nr:hypothetical protein SAMN04488118_10411 [Epibacterium ulvae]
MSFRIIKKVKHVGLLALMMQSGATSLSAEVDKYKFRAPPPADASASYCDHKGDPGYPHGNIIKLGDRVFHTCARFASNAVLTVMNAQRLPGLRYNLTAFSTGVMTADFQHITKRGRENYPDFRERITLGEGVYSVYHDEDRIVPIEGKPDEVTTAGNLYVYEGPVAGARERVPHQAKCFNENKKQIENGSYSCYIRFDWHGLSTRINVWAGGDLFSPMEHKHFPALVDDLLLLLEEVDVTDNPLRQECIRSGNGWWDGECQSAHKIDRQMTSKKGGE